MIMKDQWNPKTGGEETQRLMQSLPIDDKSKNVLLDQAVNVLSLCGNPQNSRSESVGLAFGYVQSGKTMSFTTLTSLARDNDYQIIIIIAGISTSLVDQSTERLTDDFDLRKRRDRKWVGVLKNPVGNDVLTQLETILSEWKHPTFPKDDRRSVLITVMKNTRHLLNLVGLLESLNMENVPVLIVDDEGDQASLNTKERRNALRDEDPEVFDAERDQSTIFRRIERIRELCPHHSLVQYTATPQANLFINILNRLSPNFIQLLTPGETYTGGRTYFQNRRQLVREIPFREIPTDHNPIVEPPVSLIEAMQVYFLGVVIAKIRKSPYVVSMMVHPSRLQYDHMGYYNWVNSIVQRFVLTLQQEDSDVDKIELIKQFRSAYDDLRSTSPNLPSFDKVIGGVKRAHILMHTINSTNVVLVNSSQGKTPSIDWQNHWSHILVGGQSMSRGFTVEGLTVTYMPRSVGVGNIDTIQQRARFFGYKSSYIGLCRVYLDRQTINAYSSYVEHEEHLRKSLENHNNRHLNDWERRVVLGNAYRIARSSIFSNRIIRERFLNTWIRIGYPHYTLSSIKHNRKIIEKFISEHQSSFALDEGDDRRTEEQKHLHLQVPLLEFVDRFLLDLQFVQPDDSDDLTSIITLAQGKLEVDPDSVVNVYRMSQGVSRTRRLNKELAIQNYFQGSNKRTGYPGDANVKVEDELSVQIHKLNIVDSTGKQGLYNDVYGLVFWIPNGIGKVFTVQGGEL